MPRSLFPRKLGGAVYRAASSPLTSHPLQVAFIVKLGIREAGNNAPELALEIKQLKRSLQVRRLWTPELVRLAMDMFQVRV